MYQNNLHEIRVHLNAGLVRDWELSEKDITVKTGHGVVIADCPHLIYARYIHAVRPSIVESLLGEVEQLRKIVRGKKRRVATGWYIVTRTVADRHYYGGADPEDPSWMMLTKSHEKALCFALKSSAVQEMKSRKLDGIGYIVTELPIPDECL